MPNPDSIPPDSQKPDLLLTTSPLPQDPAPANPAHGACVQFLGIVRDLENGDQILGIDYSAYPEMAKTKMAEVARLGAEEFEPHTLLLHHRIGFVPAAEPSVIIRVTTPHSQAAFDICRHYLNQLKTQIPIWKKVIPAIDADN